MILVLYVLIRLFVLTWVVMLLLGFTPWALGWAATMALVAIWDLLHVQVVFAR